MTLDSFLQELKDTFINELEAARLRASQLKDNLSPAGEAYLNARIQHLEHANIAVTNALKEYKEKGEMDMEKLKKGLVVQVVKLEDLPLRKAPRLIEGELLEKIHSLDVGKGGVIDLEVMNYRSLYAYVTKLKKQNKLEGKDIRVKKTADGQVILARYK